MPATQTAATMHIRLTLADRKIAGTFREVSGLDSESEVSEQRSVDEGGNPVVRKVPGATKWSNITLKRGVDENLDLWEWRQAVHREGAEAARADGTIELVDYDGMPVATYRFRQGWPVKYTGATLSAASGDVAVEEITICHEGFERM
jgi:phage tail-like protein